MATSVVDSIQCIAVQQDDHDNDGPGLLAPLDLHRVEIMNMPHSTYTPASTTSTNEESKTSRTMDDDLTPTSCIFINGLVLDHGARHPGMPTNLTNCHIMTCNVSLEYEKTEVQAGFLYSNAEEREKLVESERKWLDDRCRLVVDFKRKVCKEGQVSYYTNLFVWWMINEIWLETVAAVFLTWKLSLTFMFLAFMLLFTLSCCFIVICYDQSKGYRST